MAVKAIFGAIEFDWRDIKFYYNPITSLLEPIGREVHINKSFNKNNIWWVDTSDTGVNNSDQKVFKFTLQRLRFLCFVFKRIKPIIAGGLH